MILVQCSSGPSSIVGRLNACTSMQLSFGIRGMHAILQPSHKMWGACRPGMLIRLQSGKHGRQTLTIRADHHDHNLGVLGSRKLSILQPPQQLLCLVTCRGSFCSHVCRSATSQIKNEAHQNTLEHSE